MITSLKYVRCDGPCGGNPAQPADTTKEARAIARSEGFVRRGGQDLCPDCAGRNGFRYDDGRWEDYK